MDNFFTECPAMMSDGRFLADYRMPTRREEHIKYINGIVRDDVYRLFLQANGEKFLDNEWEHNKDKNYCFVNECIHTYPTRAYPFWFVEERKKYDSLLDPKREIKYPCKSYEDYRLTTTPKSSYGQVYYNTKKTY